MAIAFRTGRAVARRPTRPQALVAAGVRISPEEEPPAVDAAASQRLLLQAWQWQSFRYYDSIGEIRYSAQFYARSLQNLRLFVGRKGPDGEIEELKLTDTPDAHEILDDVQDPGGGRAGMLRSYGQLKWIIGEGYMLVTPPRVDEGTRNSWEFVSPAELQVLDGGGMLRQQAPGLSQRQIKYVTADVWEPDTPDTGVVYRYHQPHPMFSASADAPMRGVLLLCDELERLTAAVRARAVSRMAGAGILKVPDEISPPPPEPVGDEDPQEDIFLRDLIQASVSPITDPGTASAVVPMIVRGPAEFLKELDHLQIHDPRETYPEEALRSECIRRIALSLDFPPEVLLGVSDVNNWNAWQIDEQTWKTHLQPVAQSFCDDLTASYFRAACRDANVEGWEDLVVWYDPAEIINHPDRSNDFRQAYIDGAIGAEAYREAIGADDSDAPTEDEEQRRAGILLRDASYYAYGIPSVRGGAIEPAPGEIENPTGTQTDAVGGEGPSIPSAPAAAPSAPEQATTASGKLAGAVEMALERCRELAGSRLRTRITRAIKGDGGCPGGGCEEAGDLIAEVPNGLVASALVGSTHALDLPAPRELVAGGASLLRERAVAWGMTSDQAALLAESVERHAALTLFDAEPRPMKARKG